MAHTILLMQAHHELYSKTYADYSTFEDCIDGICKVYEEYLKDCNPEIHKIHYDVGHIFQFIEQMPALICLVYDEETKSYTPYYKATIKIKVYSFLEKAGKSTTQMETAPPQKRQKLSEETSHIPKKQAPLIPIWMPTGIPNSVAILSDDAAQTPQNVICESVQQTNTPMQQMRKQQIPKKRALPIPIWMPTGIPNSVAIFSNDAAQTPRNVICESVQQTNTSMQALNKKSSLNSDKQMSGKQPMRGLQTSKNAAGAKSILKTTPIPNSVTILSEDAAQTLPVPIPAQHTPKKSSLNSDKQMSGKQPMRGLQTSKNAAGAKSILKTTRIPNSLTILSEDAAQTLPILIPAQHTPKKSSLNSDKQMSGKQPMRGLQTSKNAAGAKSILITTPIPNSVTILSDDAAQTLPVPIPAQHTPKDSVQAFLMTMSERFDDLKAAWCKRRVEWNRNKLRTLKISD